MSSIAPRKSTDFSALSKKKDAGKEKGDAKQKPILQKRQSVICPVILDGIDVTPLRLNPYLYEGVKERQLTITETLPIRDESEVPSSKNADSKHFLATLTQQRQDTEALTINQKSYLTLNQDDVFVDLQRNPSEFSHDYLYDDEDDEECSTDERAHVIPEHFSLILSETETYFLLEIASHSVHKSAPDAEVVEADNIQYDYLTKGKGRYRKTVDMGIQTLPVLLKARDTEVVKTRFSQKSTYVSLWEMYDTFKDLEEPDNVSEVLEDLVNDDVEINDHPLGRDVSVESYRAASEEKQLQKLVRSKKFQDAIFVLERILANNCYNAEQKRFKGLSEPDPLRENVEYKYELKCLWTFGNNDTAGKCVSCVALNNSNEDIVAVGYGKFYFTDITSKGMVLIWNIKNPMQPERHYNFKSPVTALDFSRHHPNLLAVGFYNGDLKILDVSKRSIVVFRDGSSGSFEPLWCLMWFTQPDGEMLMASFGNGLVFRYQISDSPFLKRTQIMVTYKAQGNLKGIENVKRCTGKGVSLSRETDALCLTIHPVDPFTYYIGTGEGVVHKCSTNYYNQHMDMFLAHKGPVYYMKFSPFANKLFLTCSDDFRARLWIDGISEPLVTVFASLQSVPEVAWSPGHPTIYASIRGSDIYVWDLQRKMFMPQSKTKSPSNSKNTVLKFTENGRCLIVGDLDGNVHVFSLEHIPITPFFAENLVMLSLKKLLNTRPDLLMKIKKQGSLNYDKNTFSKYFN